MVMQLSTKCAARLTVGLEPTENRGLFKSKCMEKNYIVTTKSRGGFSPPCSPYSATYATVLYHLQLINQIMVKGSQIEAQYPRYGSIKCL